MRRAPRAGAFSFPPAARRPTPPATATVRFPLGIGSPLREPAPVPAPIAAPQFTLEILLYGLVVLGPFVALWWAYDRRDRRFYDEGRRKISFHCIRCDRLYTAPGGADLCKCPRCGHENARLRF